MRVAILAVDGMFASGLTTVLDVLSAANVLSGQAGLPAPPFDLITAGPAPAVTTAHGLTLAVTPWQALAADPPDLAVMPAVGLRPPAEVIGVVRDHPALPVLAGLCERGTGMAAACSGTFFLAEAGLLDGLTATTSWWLGPAFRARYPAVDLDESRTIAVTGNITTAGAAFAHLDLALSLVHRRSPVLADLVARYLVTGDRPSQAAVAIPALLAGADPVMAAFERYIRDHLAEPFTIGSAAGAIGVSERTLQRSARAVLGMSPVRFAQEVRLEHAVFLLRSTSQSADAVAVAVGYSDAGPLRTLARKRRSATLSSLRRS